MTRLHRILLGGAGALSLALAATGPAMAQGPVTGPAIAEGDGPTLVQYYDRDDRSSRREERRRYRDDDDDDDDRRSRRSRRDDDRRSDYSDRGNPYAQRGNSGNICVTARGNCSTYGSRPAASPCSCDIPGFGEKRGAVAAGGGGGGGGGGYGRGGYGGGYDGGSSSGVIVRRGY